MSWNIAEAKQQFSDMVRRSAKQLQLIYNRKRLVAAVIDAEQYRAFEAWRDRAHGRTLADEFSELRAILREEGDELMPVPRSSRKSSLAEILEEEAHGLPR